MISLLFKILADATGWRKVVNEQLPKDAKKAGKEAGFSAGKEFGQQMKGALMSYIGAGAVLGALQTQATRAADILREAASQDVGAVAFQELDMASKASGMSIKEIQKMALELPEQFEAMMKPIRESGQILSKEQVAELAQIKSIMAEAAISAGKLFAFLWQAGKVYSALFGAAKFASYGSEITRIGSIVEAATGNKVLSTLGRSMLQNAGDTAGAAVAGRADASTSETPVNQFVRDSNTRAKELEFNQWWESVGGQEASMLGGSSPSRLTSSENVYTNADLITRDNMQRPRGGGTSVSSPQVVSKLEQIRQTLESRL